MVKEGSQNLIDPEQIFQLLAKKEWAEISKFMYRNKDSIGKDPLINKAIELFESEFFEGTDTLGLVERKKEYEYPGLIIDLNQHAFSERFVNAFIDRKIDLLKQMNSDALVSYASQNQHREKARIVLNEMQASKPEAIADERRVNVSIKSNNISTGKPKLVNLFKSKQEQYFFEAVIAAFPTYHPYPNVALNAVFDFEGIKSDLSQNEREYFFRGLIDVVVFDTRHGYEPKYFIELDSVYHDSERAKYNDNMKNNIFQAANIKLIRIRPYDKSEVTVAKFKDLVMEVMRDL